MGDVIDFKSALHRITTDLEDPQAPHAGDEVELTYDPKPGSVGVTVSTTADGVAHLTVTAPAAEIAPTMAMAQSALLQSFGIAPNDTQSLEMVRETMGAPTFDAFIATFVQQHFFSQAMLRTSIMPFLDPDYLTSDAPVADQDYTFKVDTLLRPSFALSSYDPVKVELPEKQQITSKDVSAYLANMADELATWENDPSRDAVIEGDHVTLNLDATADGKEFKPLTGRHLPYLVGSGVISPDFDGELVGMKPRERREVSVSVALPNEAGEITYQVVQIKAQIDEIQRKVPAKIDDAWVAANMPEAQTLLGLRSRIRTVLEREVDRAYHDQLMILCAEELAKRLEGDPDDRYVAKMRDELIAQFIGDLQRSGIDYQQYMSQPGFDAKAWEAQMAEEARKALRRGLALDSLADHLDIDLREEDIAQVVAQMAPGHEQEALQGLLDSGQMPKMCEVALRMRANEWLVDHVAGTGRVIDGGAPKKSAKDDGPKNDGPKLQLI